MISFRDALLTDGLSDIIAKEPWAVALAYAFKKQALRIMDAADGCMPFARLEALSDDALNAFAVEMNVPQYSESLERESREALVRNSMETFLLSGTKKSVLEVVRAVFGDSEITEWWEPGFSESPMDGYFRVTTYAQDVTGDNVKEFKRTASATKRLSAWLERVRAMYYEKFDLSQLESIHVPKLDLLAGISFWNVAHYDGTLRYDGESRWRFDGTVHYDGVHDFDDAHRYDAIMNEFSALLDVGCITLHAPIRETVHMDISGNMVKTSENLSSDTFSILKRWRFDGNSSFDGNMFYDDDVKEEAI